MARPLPSFLKECTRWEPSKYLRPLSESLSSAFTCCLGGVRGLWTWSSSSLLMLQVPMGDNVRGQESCTEAKKDIIAMTIA